MIKTAILGCHAFTPLGEQPGEILDRMLRSEKGAKQISGFDTSGLTFSEGGELADFDAVKYLGKKGLRQLDRTGRLAAVTAGMALDQAGWDEAYRADHEVALVLGTNFCSAGSIASFDQRGLELGPTYVSPLDFANTVINAAAGQTAIRYNLRGTNSTTTGGCCAGLKALAYAHDLIVFGYEERVLAGGAEELTPATFTAFDRSPYMGKRGFFLSEGAAFVPLVSEEAASPTPCLGKIVDHRSCLLLSAGSMDVLTSTVTALLSANGLDVTDIDLVCLSAAGYEPIDDVESEVVDRVFDTRAARFAPKHWLGEGLGMSGPLQLLLSLEVLKRGVLPPGPGTSGSLAAGSRLALLLGLSYDGLFEVVLIEGGGGA